MNVAALIININSVDPNGLMAFYHDVVGLPKHPDENRESALMLGPNELVFDSHSEVSGRSSQPGRIMLNLFVDDLAAEQKRIEAHGVKFIRSAGKEYWGGVFSTFEDPDGNYLQLVEFKPS